jgi:hypothetical protein
LGGNLLKQGWLGIDPTNNIWTMENHVKLSVGLNFSECTLLKELLRLRYHKLSVSVSIGFGNFEEINDVQLQNDLLRFRKN